MTLKYELDSLDGLEEAIAKLYIEKDGKFILDVTGHEKPENKDMIPISRLNAEITKRKEAETNLTKICESMVESVPEDKRAFIPDLAPSAKIAWIEQANAKGLFAEKKTEALDTKKPGDQKPADFRDMTPQAIMATGYTTKA